MRLLCRAAACALLALATIALATPRVRAQAAAAPPGAEPPAASPDPSPSATTAAPPSEETSTPQPDAPPTPDSPPAPDTAPSAPAAPTVPPLQAKYRLNLEQQRFEYVVAAREYAIASTEPARSALGLVNMVGFLAEISMLIAAGVTDRPELGFYGVGAAFATLGATTWIGRGVLGRAEARLAPDDPLRLSIAKVRSKQVWTGTFMMLAAVGTAMVGAAFQVPSDDASDALVAAGVITASTGLLATLTTLLLANETFARVERWREHPVYPDPRDAEPR